MIFIITNSGGSRISRFRVRRPIGGGGKHQPPKMYAKTKELGPIHNAKLAEVRWSVTRYAFLRHLVGSM